MKATEILVLNLLDQHREGLYGSDIPRLSEGKVGKLAAYTALDSLVEAGLAREVEEEASSPIHLPRTKHFISDNGKSALAMHRAEQDAKAAGNMPPLAPC